MVTALRTVPLLIGTLLIGALLIRAALLLWASWCVVSHVGVLLVVAALLLWWVATAELAILLRWVGVVAVDGLGRLGAGGGVVGRRRIGWVWLRHGDGDDLVFVGGVVWKEKEVGRRNARRFWRQCLLDEEVVVAELKGPGVYGSGKDYFRDERWIGCKYLGLRGDKRTRLSVGWFD